MIIATSQRGRMKRVDAESILPQVLPKLFQRVETDVGTRMLHSV